MKWQVYGFLASYLKITPYESVPEKKHVTKKEREKKKEFGYLYKFSLNSLMNMTRDWSDLLVYAWLNRLFSSTVTWINQQLLQSLLWWASALLLCYLMYGISHPPPPLERLWLRRIRFTPPLLHVILPFLVRLSFLYEQKHVYWIS